MLDWRNVAKLLALIWGVTIIICIGILGIGIVYDEIAKPCYKAATSAVYIYAEGNQMCDRMNGAVDLMIQRGYNIEKQKVFGISEEYGLPVMLFFDEDDEEIVESRMGGLWSLYDVKIRFGE